ncbi:MAG: hypothetical protein HY542_07785 [Deltaproteobacteria bacterium]|nr:hypothetical protein [Deltaproteobacteria bacterium]
MKCVRRFLVCAGIFGVLFLPPTLSVAGPRVELAEGGTVGEENGGSRWDRFHLFGYGELHYNNRIGSIDDDIDFHRMVLGLGYDFTDRWNFRMELDFEHAFIEPELEFAYVDYLYRPGLNLRAGSILVPIGVINQHHEPPLFYSVERPEVYRVLIPTTWQEGGAGLYGSLGDIHYELYGLSSLNATGFTGSNGLRVGRGHVGEAPGRDFGGAGRLEYRGVPGLRVGSSLFTANSGQGNGTIDGGFLVLAEGDAKYSLEGFDLDGIFVYSHLSDAGAINTVRVAADAAFTNFVATEMIGWYAEAAYHLFHHLWPGTKQDLVLFGRFEDFNTQQSMPSGFAANLANDRNTWTSGISYLPIPQVALKADYMANWNRANSGTDQFNLGVGFMY